MKQAGIVLFMFVFNIFVLFEASGQANQEFPLVLTCLQPTYSFASILTKDTSIKVSNLGPAGYPMGRLGRYFKTHEKEIKNYAARADAVITIRSVWKHDPLYIYARKWNIRIIEIDASMPFAPALTGVSILEVPDSCPLLPGTQTGKSLRKDHQTISPFIWLSLSNASKMLSIIAGDLKRLSPKDAAVIDKNLVTFKKKLFRLRLKYENIFAELESLEVFGLTDVFPYFTNDLTFHVTGYFLKDDFYWTKEDLSNLKIRLQQDKIKVVIHKWQPKPEIIQAVMDARAKLVVLNSMNPAIYKEGRIDPDGYLKNMRNNLEIIASAFAASQ
ncbi:MAG: zinc ABC transporter solute-binding protein [Desulfobacteraceae bacterium]|nr:zinc ABC transporter solute-binding protein [Desulfobacteraceae bacterium]MBC2718573.1 zinc ABC transporter substrate-binding protein [Desulfobacteraceae bacterium]